MKIQLMTYNYSFSENNISRKKEKELASKSTKKFVISVVSIHLESLSETPIELFAITVYINP